MKIMNTFSLIVSDVINNYYTITAKLIFKNKTLKKDFYRHENRFLHTPCIGTLPVSLCPSQSVVNLRLQLLRIPLTVIVRISHDPCTMWTGFGKRRKRKLYSQTVNAAAIWKKWFVFSVSRLILHLSSKPRIYWNHVLTLYNREIDFMYKILNKYTMLFSFNFRYKEIN